jgi:hypothetical protein
MTGRPMRLALTFLILALGGCGDPNPGACGGECAPRVPVEEGWFATLLLWTGSPSATPPVCPEVLPSSDLGFADVAPSVTCPSCSCAPSIEAQCFLAQQLSGNASACPGDAGMQPFNAPEPWSGACTAMDAVSSANSVTVSPPRLQQSGICPSISSGKPSNIQGQTRAQICGSPSTGPAVPSGTCANQQQTCVYTPTPGYSSCIITSGDMSCPSGWPKKHLYYGDSEDCTCTCGAPVGETCSGTVTVYADSACASPLAAVFASSDQPPVCANVTPGSALGSKSATAPVYQSGTCAPVLTQTFAHTLCCLP